MKGLGVHGEAGEHHVVHLRHRSGDRVAIDRSDLEVLEPQSHAEANTTQ